MNHVAMDWRIRVAVRLFRVSDGSLVWAENFDERETDIFVLQDTIADKVAQSLSLKLSADEERNINRRSTDDLEGVSSVQQGLEPNFDNLRSDLDLRTFLKGSASEVSALDQFIVSLIIHKPGILTTIRDLGRVGYRRFGINPGGPMDTAAARIANILVDNDDNAPVIEMYFPAPQIGFESNASVALCGADFGAELDGHTLSNWSTTKVGAGSVLSFPRKQQGNVAYVAIGGGVDVVEWLGSSTTNLTAGVGGFEGRSLAEGDRVNYGKNKEIADITLGASLRPRYSRFPTIRIVAGSEFELLTASADQDFFREGFALANECDRMGFRLAGKPLHLLHDIQLVSSAVTFGTVQLLPNGQIIVLMADHQTSGGYPKIGNVISADLPILAQCGPGDGISFQAVSLDDAQRAALEFERELNFLRVGCRLRNQNVDC